MRGEEIEAMIKRVMVSPPDVIERARKAIEAGKGMTTVKEKK